MPNRTRSKPTARVITIASDKGGAGKSTAAVNLAAAAAADSRVLLVDCDQQGAAGAGLGVTVTKPTLYEALAGRAEVTDAIQTTSVENLHLLPADGDLAAATLELPRRDGWATSLRGLLAPLLDRYDLVVMDTPPGLTVLTFCALVAADEVLVTLNPSFPDLRVLANVFSVVDQARDHPGADPKITGIIPSRVGRRTRHRDEVLDELAKHWPDLVLPQLPDRVVFPDAALEGQPVIAYAPHSAAADAVRALTGEVLARG